MDGSVGGPEDMSMLSVDLDDTSEIIGVVPLQAQNNKGEEPSA
jgi:hypothetical protein